MRKVFEHNRVCKLFEINVPIIQAGMIWASGWELASAVSNAGGLGLIGAGSMRTEILRSHIKKCREACGNKPFGVNVPLVHPDTAGLLRVVGEEGVPIVFTSAGNPRTYTSTLKQHGMKVVHVVSSAKFALKAQEAGCDAVVAEGFEAGGHNGREETTTLVLLPSVRKALEIPLLAAGGIYNGRSMLAAMTLGAEGVQIGSRFVCTTEASSHQHFKDAVVQAKEGDTKLILKQLEPVRMLKNAYMQRLAEAELAGKTKEELREMMGKSKTRKGMFEGDIEGGDLEIGQVSALIDSIKPAAEVVAEIVDEFERALLNPLDWTFTKT
jgi:enoyl-[acyl-carrier protein] reductase II